MHVLLFLLLVTTFFPLIAEDKIQNPPRNAVAETQNILRDPAKRREGISNSPEAQQADQNLRSLGGSQQTNDDIYSLSADIFGTLEKSSGGDPEKMDSVLQNAMTNPEGFATTFTPEQRKRLREIADTIEQSKSVP